MINIIAIVIQPSHSSEVVNIRWSPTDPSIVNKQETVLLSVSDMHKFIFISELTGAGMFIYIAMFVFSKRITTLTTRLKTLFLAVIFLSLALIKLGITPIVVVRNGSISNRHKQIRKRAFIAILIANTSISLTRNVAVGFIRVPSTKKVDLRLIDYVSSFHHSICNHYGCRCN
jgi:hypothetical protein